MAVTSGHVLPCGCDVEQVWEAIGLSGGHARSCPHCAAVRESLLVLRAATAELARDQAEPSSGLVSRVMSAVRAEVRRSDVLPSPGDGPARMSMRAVAMAGDVGEDPMCVRLVVTDVDGRSLDHLNGT
ncbi:hypothetical protein SAMN05216188_104162 [Lentzea xinjiangensis]|uniref:Uncharacterized protein n=1 Tax=Lentzea xinjiangensis TaxID=402600 RepID=A0A1H9HR66_9PSEU|nr:hypothetical protein [Lentzea xinjiangensis]SEQ64839.1 hypothetical protein SAMN05216188_104162 [Lentzea xinjiangensis]